MLVKQHKKHLAGTTSLTVVQCQTQRGWTRQHLQWPQAGYPAIIEHFVDGNITARVFIEQILHDPHMIPFMQQRPGVTIFQQDNTCANSARVTQAYPQAQGVDVLP
ncbi:uncharacterized protein V6R79_010597 [Siganus canaliculatus]